MRWPWHILGTATLAVVVAGVKDVKKKSRDLVVVAD
jgi:hypothetical protein